jgi:hypothetical protein
MVTSLLPKSRRIAHNGWPHDRTRLRRCSAMKPRLPGGTRRVSPAAVSNPALRHHRHRHRGDDTNPNDHALPARTEHAARGAARQDARGSRNRYVQPAVTTATNRPARPEPTEARYRRDNETDSLRQATRPAAHAPSNDEYEQPGPASSDACFARAKRASARGRSTLSEVVQSGRVDVAGLHARSRTIVVVWSAPTATRQEAETWSAARLAGSSCLQTDAHGTIEPCARSSTRPAGVHLRTAHR